MLYALGIGLLLGFLSLVSGGKTSASKGRGETGVFCLEELPEKLILASPDDTYSFEITIFRQSGNIERALYASSKEEALREVEKLFRRMKEDSVRIWANHETSFDVRRPYGSLNGRREGRKIWGCQVAVIPDVES